MREITDREIEESYQVRSVLEPLAAELAAANLKNNTQDIEKEVQAFQEAARKRDVQKYSRHDMEFHAKILEAAGNELLSALWKSVVLEGRSLMTLRHLIGEDELETLAAAHLPILEPLNAGQTRKTGSLARELICTFHSRPSRKEIPPGLAKNISGE